MDEQSKLESKILALLERGLNPQQIFEKIKNHRDFEKISQFLYIAGLDKTLLKFSTDRLERGEKVAWAYILPVFIKHKIDLNLQTQNLLFDLLLKDPKNKSFTLLASTWKNKKFKQFKKNVLQQITESNPAAREQNLLDRLDFVKAKKLLKEEEDIINQLLAIAPNKKEYRILKEKWEEQHAIWTIQNQKKQKDLVSVFSFVGKDHDPIKEEWFNIVQSVAKKNPQHIKYLALFLYFCNWTDKALSLLETHIQDRSDYWFYLEWTLETRQYTKGLELVNSLFKEAKSKELFIPLTYIKAQIFYGLGKKEEAIEYLANIVRVKPSYKNTQYFLDQWTKCV